MKTTTIIKIIAPIIFLLLLLIVGNGIVNIIDRNINGGEVATQNGLTLGIASDVLSYVVPIIVAVVIFGVAFLFIRKYWREIMQFFAPDEGEPVGEVVLSAVEQLDNHLAEVESGAQDAEQRLTDCYIQSQSLVGLVKTFSDEAATMSHEADLVDELLGLLNQPLQNTADIMKAAGQLTDENVRRLVFHSLEEDQTSNSVTKLLAERYGVMTTWTHRYYHVANDLIAALSATQSRTAEIAATLKIAGAASTVARIEANLSDATRALPVSRNTQRSMLSLTNQYQRGGRLLAKP